MSGPQGETKVSSRGSLSPAGRRHLRVVKGRHAELASEFQPDAVELEERRPPRLARATLYVVALLIAAAIAWASMTHVDEVVTAQGKLITSAPRIVIQPLETSVIRTLEVAVGDVVHKGQVLAQLDPTFSQSDFGQLENRLAVFDAQINRLEAELGNQDYTLAPDANPEEVLQQQLFMQRRASLRSAVANYDQQIARDEATLASNIKEQTLLDGRRQTMLEIEKMRSTLLDHQTGSRLNYLQSKDARLDIDTTIQRLKGKQVELQHSIEKGRTERQSTIEDFRRQSMELLVETRGKRRTAAEELKKAELRRHMVTMTAPADGVVLDVAQRSIGSVVREAETMFVVVPLDGTLEAEVMVEGKDIGHLKVGQPVRVKFDAFQFQKYGTAAGTVRLISQDSFTNDQQQQKSDARPAKATPPVYRIRVNLTDIRLKGLPEGFHMLPGMPVTAEVKVGLHNVAAYFLYPLLRGLDESIREP